MGLETTFYLMIGLFVMSFAIWSRAGRTSRSRWWVDAKVLESGALMVIPAFALFLLLAGLSPFIPDGGALTWPVGLLLILAVGLTLWGVLVQRIPRWFYPRWYRVNKGWVSSRKPGGR